MSDIAQREQNSHPKTRERVTFHGSDIEGITAFLIIERHNDGTASSVKLLEPEMIALFEALEAMNWTTRLGPPE